MTTAISLASFRKATVISRDRAPLLSVDLDAIRSNYREVRRRYQGEILSAVVKSDAYGLGLDAIVGALLQAGCRVFWANDLAEASHIRSLAPNARIFTLMGLAGHHVSDFEAASVFPALAGLDEVEICARHGLLEGRRIAVAVQIDTGLGRLGLGEEELAFLSERPDILDRLDVRLWVSHLASYNLPHDPRNLAQRAMMAEWLSRLPRAPVSLAASSAVFMGSSWHFDVARVGSALYGVQTSVEWQENLVPCYELRAPILRVTDFPAGRQLGYRAVTTLDRPSRIATIAIGYANGLPQRFGECGMARIGDYAAPLVGGIAMNMSMLDVTDVPTATLLEHDAVVLLDRHQPVELIADRLGCAPNLLLTQIGAGTAKRYAGD
jgi:alanine racemase